MINDRACVEGVYTNYLVKSANMVGEYFNINVNLEP